MGPPREDIAFVDAYAARTGSGSRPAAIHPAIELLRASELERDDTAAWQEWAEDEDADPWDATAPDGLGDAAR